MKTGKWQVIKNVLLFNHEDWKNEIKEAYSTRIRYLRFPITLEKALWIFETTVKNIIRERNEKRLKDLINTSPEL